MSYELVTRDNGEYYLKSSFGLVSVHELRFDRNELFWREKKKIEHMLIWLQENHPEVML